MWRVQVYGSHFSQEAYLKERFLHNLKFWEKVKCRWGYGAIYPHTLSHFTSLPFGKRKYATTTPFHQNWITYNGLVQLFHAHAHALASLGMLCDWVYAPRAKADWELLWVQNLSMILKMNWFYFAVLNGAWWPKLYCLKAKQLNVLSSQHPFSPQKEYECRKKS